MHLHDQHINLEQNEEERQLNSNTIDHLNCLNEELPHSIYKDELQHVADSIGEAITT